MQEKNQTRVIAGRRRWTAFYVDIDGLLIRTYYFDKMKAQIPTGFVDFPGPPSTSIQGRPDRAIIARPSAISFLKALAQYGQVNILTDGVNEWQSRKLELLGMRDLVKDVFGRDCAEGAIVLPKYWLLIDDKSPTSISMKNKWRQLLGESNPPDYVFERHFVHDDRWPYVYDDPHPLTNLLPLIAEKLERQKHRCRFR